MRTANFTRTLTVTEPASRILLSWHLMSDLRRIGVALSGELLDKFDHLMEKRGYTNRSEAFRDLIRADLVTEVARAGSTRVIGTLTLVYNHHVRLLSDKLTNLQHDAHHLIISTIHAHLDHDNCVEVILLRGKSSEVHAFSEALIATKGIKHGKLVVASTDTALP